MDFLTKALAKFIGNQITALLGFVIGGVKDTYEGWTKQFLEQGSIKTIHNIFLGLAILLIIFFCVKRYFDVFVMESSGDPDSDPIDILVNGTKATAIATSSSWIFATYINFTMKLADLVILNLQTDMDYEMTLKSTLDTFITNLVTGGFMWILLISFVVIGLLIFLVMGVIRAVELMLMYVIYPLFCVELCFTSHEKYNGFLINVCVTGGYYILQLVCFYMLIESIVSGLSGVTVDSSVAFPQIKMIGWLIACLRSPKWLDKFIYSTGIGDKASRGLGGLARSFIGTKVR